MDGQTLLVSKVKLLLLFCGVIHLPPLVASLNDTLSTGNSYTDRDWKKLGDYSIKILHLGDY